MEVLDCSSEWQYLFNGVARFPLRLLIFTIVPFLALVSCAKTEKVFSFSTAYLNCRKKLRREAAKKESGNEQILFPSTASTFVEERLNEIFLRQLSSQRLPSTFYYLSRNYTTSNAFNGNIRPCSAAIAEGCRRLRCKKWIVIYERCHYSK